MDKLKACSILPGNPEHLGARAERDGVNFAAAIPDEKEAQLVLVDENRREIRSIELAAKDRTGEVSAVFLSGIDPASFGYYYRIEGEKTLDPYAAQIADGVCRCIGEECDWEGDRAPSIPFEDLMIYKLHVRGFTRKAGSDVKHKGTFLGLQEKIPYIAELGFNAVELLPIYEFDETLKIQPFSGTKIDENGIPKAEPMRNYWGYAEKNWYFAPKARYAATKDSVGELRSMIRAFHRAGIEVILELYFPEGTDPCTAIRVIRHWKSAYHIDGFHFIGNGTPYEAVVRDPLLKRTKLFLERVDPYWLYRGDVPKYRNIAEYNSDFEHVGRALLKGDEGQVGTFAQFLRRNPATHAYVNSMADVNGFTLLDAVSYDWKHNEANGEGNQDGTTFNYSWNCGVEGPSRKKNVRQLRLRQLRNALLYVFLAQGIPMLRAGDEGLNTQGGNNNAYASDDAVGWTDWNTGRDAEQLRAFVRKLTALRKKHRILHMPAELKGMDYKSLGYPDISFHDSKAWVCSFENVTRTLAVLLCGLYTQTEGEGGDDFLYVAYNAYWEAHKFALPQLPRDFAWYPLVDTSAVPGEEFRDENAAPVRETSKGKRAANGGSPETDGASGPECKFCEAGPRSVVVCAGRRRPKEKRKKAK